MYPGEDNTSRQARGGNRDELFSMPIRIKGISRRCVYAHLNFGNDRRRTIPATMAAASSGARRARPARLVTPAKRAVSCK